MDLHFKSLYTPSRITHAAVNMISFLHNLEAMFERDPVVFYNFSKPIQPN